jgi:hypothetical protein
MAILFDGWVTQCSDSLLQRRGSAASNDDDGYYSVPINKRPDEREQLRVTCRTLSARASLSLRTANVKFLSNPCSEIYPAVRR